MAVITVYPRVYGERRKIPERQMQQGGLSPRIRGTGSGGKARIDEARFIPAYTGNG